MVSSGCSHAFDRRNCSTDICVEMYREREEEWVREFKIHEVTRNTHRNGPSSSSRRLLPWSKCLPTRSQNSPRSSILIPCHSAWADEWSYKSERPMFSSLKDASAFIEKKNKNRDNAQQKSGERAEKRRRVMVRVASIFLVYLIRFVRGLARVVMSLVRKESRISLILSL